MSFRENAIKLNTALEDNRINDINHIIDNLPVDYLYINQKFENLLLVSIYCDNIDAALKILDKPLCGINHVDKLGNTPLLFSIKKHYYSISLKILSNKVHNINYIDHHGDSAFSCAIRYNHTEIINKLLCYKNLHVNHIDKHGDSCLLIAIDNLREDVALKILERPNININYVNKHGFSALILAITKLMRKLSHKLLDLGVDTSLVANNGDTALITALNKNFLDIAERINNNDDESNNSCINKYGDIALFHAINLGNEELCLNMYKKDKKNIEIVNKEGNTSLILALTNNMYALSELLIDEGSKDFIRHINNDNNSALFICISKCYWALAIKIINKKYYFPNHLNNEGNSIINYIINFGDENLALKVLDDFDVNVNLIFSKRDEINRIKKNISDIKLLKVRVLTELYKEENKLKMMFNNNDDELSICEQENIIEVKRNIIEKANQDTLNLTKSIIYIEKEFDIFGRNKKEGNTLLIYSLMNKLINLSKKLIEKMDSNTINQVNIKFIIFNNI